MSKKLILILVIAVVVLAGGGGAAFFLLRPASDEAAAAAAAEEPPGIFSMETFLVNVNDPAGERYAKLNLQLTVKPASAAQTISDDGVLQAKMRDRVLTLLTSKTVPELMGPIGKEAFRREIKTHLGPLLREGQIEEVLFSEFVVQ